VRDFSTGGEVEMRPDVIEACHLVMSPPPPLDTSPDLSQTNKKSQMYNRQQ
ncbi:hypothetical protein J6590_096753, partial [Homalodisca vitripennis]